MSLIGSPTPFVLCAGTTSEPLKLELLVSRYAVGHPAGGVTDWMLIDVTVSDTLSGLVAVYQTYRCTPGTSLAAVSVLCELLIVALIVKSFAAIRRTFG